MSAVYQYVIIIFSPFVKKRLTKAFLFRMGELSRPRSTSQQYFYIFAIQKNDRMKHQDNPLLQACHFRGDYACCFIAHLPRAARSAHAFRYPTQRATALVWGYWEGVPTGHFHTLSSAFF